MKPFLLLAIRAEDAAADNEYDSFVSLSGLAEGELRRDREVLSVDMLASAMARLPPGQADGLIAGLRTLVDLATPDRESRE